MRRSTCGRWELDRGPQELAYDFWWHLGYDTMVTSEWGTPDMFEDGLIPEKILGSEYGHRLHFWDLLKRRHVQEIDLGKEHQLATRRVRSAPANAQRFQSLSAVCDRHRPVG
jgi:56kDa selenium binding protein (SBP56)